MSTPLSIFNPNVIIFPTAQVQRQAEKQRDNKRRVRITIITDNERLFKAHTSTVHAALLVTPRFFNECTMYGVANDIPLDEYEEHSHVQSYYDLIDE